MRRDESARPQQGARPAALVPEGVALTLRRGVRRAAGRRHGGTTAVVRAALERGPQRHRGAVPPRRAWAVSPLDRDDGERRSLVAVGGALTIFIVFALAIWSQLTIGWQWSAPDTAATSWAMPVMSAAIVAFGALCVASAVPVLWSVGRRLAEDRAGRLLRPAAVDHRRARGPRRRHASLRQRVAGDGRAPLGPPGHRARRRRRLRLGLHAVRDLVLGAPGRAGRLPHQRGGLDGGEPDRPRRRARRHRQAGAPAGSLAAACSATSGG